jgi:hypothetical protein
VAGDHALRHGARHDSTEERNRIEADFRAFLAATEPGAHAALVAVEATAA